MVTRNSSSNCITEMQKYKIDCNRLGNAEFGYIYYLFCFFFLCGSIVWIKHLMGFVVSLLINAANKAINFRINPVTST